MTSEPLDFEKTLVAPTSQPMVERRRGSVSSIVTEDSVVTQDDTTGLRDGTSSSPHDHAASGFPSDDLTGFEGELDVVLPGEALLSHRIKRAGRVKRARARNVQRRTLPPQLRYTEHPLSPLRSSFLSNPDEESQEDMDVERSSHWRRASRESRQGLVKNALPISTPSIQPPTPALRHLSAEPFPPNMVASTSMGEGSSTSHRRASSQQSWLPLHCSPPQSPRAFMYSDQEKLPKAVEEKLEEWEYLVTPVQVNLDERELRDIANVAEDAKPGKPKLSRILAFELDEAAESLMVTCESAYLHVALF